MDRLINAVKAIAIRSSLNKFARLIRRGTSSLVREFPKAEDHAKDS